MELRHLRYFVTVAEHGNVSRAARKLFIAQPPLSAQLKQLEEEVGTPLFTRLPRGVRLTPAGESFLEDARAILARAQQAPVRAREWEQRQQALVRIGAVPSSLHSVLPGLLQKIQAAGWNVRLEVREMITSQQLTALRRSDLELGIARPDSPDSMPEEIFSIDDPYCLAVPAGSTLSQGDGPVDLRQVAREPFVGFTRYQDTDFFDRTAALCHEAGFTPAIRHEAGQFINVLALVACGLGVAIVPQSFAQLYTGQVVFRRLRPSGIRSRMSVLGDPQMAGTARLVRDAVIDEMERLRQRLGGRAP